MSSRSTDIIRWVIDRMLAHDDSITQELALTVEREARAEWGGQSIAYIAKRCAADRPSPADVQQDYARMQDVREVARRHGIGRSQVYNLLKRRDPPTST